ncbi:MAG: hypothetical protein Q7I93_04540, partial [Syntrophales bacterium]|nr:hypothetical protein [Syntrophales bacterium]
MFAIGKLVFLFLRAAGNFAIVLLALPVFLSCHYDDGLSVTMSPYEKGGLSRLAVLPFREI